MEGSLLRHGPSAILSLSVEGSNPDTRTVRDSGPQRGGSRLDTEPSVIWSIIVEGSLLRYGPSVISSLRVEGSNTGSRTVRDIGRKSGG